MSVETGLLLGQFEDIKKNLSRKKSASEALILLLAFERVTGYRDAGPLRSDGLGEHW